MKLHYYPLCLCLLSYASVAPAQNPYALDASDGSPTEAVFVNDTGKVGVGTTDPKRTFHVVGGTLLTNTEADATTKTLTVEGRHYSNAEGSVLYLWGISQSNSTLFRIGSSHQTFKAPTQIELFTAPTNTSAGLRRMLIAPTGNVGIGANNPQEKLVVNGTVQVLSGGVKFPDGTVQTTAPGPQNTLAAADGSPADAVFVDNVGNVGIGTTTPDALLAVNGTIKAREVQISADGWPDYVFARDYELTPLSEIEAAIATQGHLPGMPSAADVAAEGIALGEMQAKLLEKIEELTLHLIALDKTNQELRAELDTVRRGQAETISLAGVAE